MPKQQMTDFGDSDQHHERLDSLRKMYIDDQFNQMEAMIKDIDVISTNT